ncbi:hypothetical protein GWO43_05075 [candidate division KSB1 bacterium]|nr:hypothetical protein [candidate division KSB1 bacterium]NIR71456.1 hypothetical protein [candidate division KSB1 bacterium]NIS23377.1 hypothetical protein [candidate division KSB1 bacterium]NIT70268.1 hypothetical protein [candidate division KSB1 bacterium]NIU23991.1 hypothetical protein [candidate division KSB1 bacterium]
MSDTFEQDRLLKGGRISRTHNLAPGESKAYSLFTPALPIPADTPHDEYCLGAVVDPGKKVAESNEGNNTACHTISIIHQEPKRRAANITTPISSLASTFHSH